jgi:hypothetical protein
MSVNAARAIEIPRGQKRLTGFVGPARSLECERAQHLEV